MRKILSKFLLPIFMVACTLSCVNFFGMANGKQDSAFADPSYVRIYNASQAQIFDGSSEEGVSDLQALQNLIDAATDEMNIIVFNVMLELSGQDNDSLEIEYNNTLTNPIIFIKSAGMRNDPFICCAGENGTNLSLTIGDSSSTTTQFIFDGEGYTFDSVQASGKSASAICMDGDKSSISVYNTQFINFNSVVDEVPYNGVVYVNNSGAGNGCEFENVTFLNNISASDSNNVSANTLCITASQDVSLKECVFENNTGATPMRINLPQGEGSMDLDLFLDGCSFVRNQSASSSSIFVVPSINELDISNCEFLHNTGAFGIKADPIEVLSITNSHFDGNIANNVANGSVQTASDLLYSASDGSVTIKGTSFANGQVLPKANNTNSGMVVLGTSEKLQLVLGDDGDDNKITFSSRRDDNVNGLLIKTSGSNLTSGEIATLKNMHFSGFGKNAFVAQTSISSTIPDRPESSLQSFDKVNFSIISSTFEDCFVGMNLVQAGNWTIVGCDFNGIADHSMTAISVTNIASLDISNCAFELCCDSLGAIRIHNDTNFANVDINNPDINHLRTEIVSISGCLFDNDTSASVSGGAINVENVDELNITNSTFDGNISSQSHAGAIYVNNVPVVLLNGLEFTNNIASGSAGAVYVEAVDELSIQSTTFKDNYANLNGGALFVSVGEVVINSSRFEGNESGGSAGAIYLDTTCDSVEINNCAFVSNSASGVAGAIYASGIASFTLQGDIDVAGRFVSQFISNNAYGQGSALCLNNMNNVIIKGIQFTSNVLYADGIARVGGALYIEDSNVSIQGCQMNENISSLCGGAIAVYFVNSVCSVEVLDTAIVNNSASEKDSVSYGGAISIDSKTNNNSVAFDGCIVTGNSSITNGGAFYLKGDQNNTNTSITISNSHIGSNYRLNSQDYSSNTSNVGHALYAQNIGIINVQNTQVANSTIANGQSYVVFVKNEGTAFRTKFNFVESRFTSNTDVNVYVSGSNRTANPLYCVSGNVDAVISGCEFDGNRCITSMFGFDSSSKNYVIEDTAFVGNYLDNMYSSSEYIMGLVNIFDQNNVIRNCRFENNIAGSRNNGCAIYFSGSNYSYTLMGCEFIGNESGRGSAVYVDTNAKNISLIIDNCEFVSNSATNGGAVWTSDELVVKSSRFVSNNATNYGGAIRAQKINVISSDFISNRANYGGSIYLGGESSNQTGRLVIYKS